MAEQINSTLTLGDCERALIEESGVTPLGTPSPSESFYKPGDWLGEYQLDRLLGSGGTGHVYRAGKRAGAASEVGSGWSSLVALKLLRRSGAKFLHRFKHEFRTLADVAHPNLVSLDELVVLASGAAFFTMEYVDGVPFVEWIRGRTPAGEAPDMRRIRGAFRQLIAALGHIHGLDIVHRDIKPSNVLVTRSGRVVVLDFGLVRDLSERDTTISDDHVVGTPAYMAPEQAAFMPAGAAVDLYAVGVMLYETLVGARPFVGTVAEVLFAKQREEAPRVRDLLPDVDEELDDLVARLLARDPASRPALAELRACFGGGARGPGPMVEQGGDPGFVGREAELEALRAAFVSIREDGSALTMHLRGPSGYGKSRLVQRFLDELSEADEAVVLRARCFERESLPYKGLDGLIDALTVYLHRLGEGEVMGLLPRHMGPLVEMFPVLASASSSWGQTFAPGVEPYELRRQAFAALRELLSRLGDRLPVVLSIDDFHWADVDSAQVLLDLIRPPDSPRLLLIVSHREIVGASAAAQLLRAPTTVAACDTRELRIEPLRPAAARILARMAIEARGGEASEARVAAYAEASAGNPFMIEQLVRAGEAARALAEARDVVSARLDKLGHEPLVLLAVLALAGAPLAREVACSVAGLEEPELAVTELLEEELVVFGGDGRADELEVGYEGIRAAALEGLDTAQLSELHLALAEHYEARAADPELIAHHYSSAGERGRAADASEAAADRAARALAFARAQAGYERTLELLDASAEPQRYASVQLRLAGQLVNLGRNHEASDLILALSAGQTGPEARRHRAYAAELLLRSGYVDEGMSVFSSLLGEVKMKLPRRPAAVISSLLWELLRLRARGRRYELREAADVEPALLDRIDACEAVASGASLLEYALTGLFHARGLRLALEAGEPRRLSRSLAVETIIATSLHQHERAREEQKRARELAELSGDALALAFVEMARATTAFHHHRWREACDQLAAAVDAFAWIEGGVPDRRTAGELYLWARVCRGHIREVRALASRQLERVSETKDLRVLTDVAALLARAELYAGHEGLVAELLEEAEAALPKDRYLWGHMLHAEAMVLALLCRGEAGEALALARRTARDMRKAMLHRMPGFMLGVATLELLAELHAAIAAQADAKACARLHARARDLRKWGFGECDAAAAVVEAALAERAGDLAAARRRLAEAARVYEEVGMDAHLCAVSHVQIELAADDSDDEAQRTRVATYREREGLADVARLAALLAPRWPAPPSS